MNKDYMVNDIKNEMKACIDNMTEFNMCERRSRL